MLTPKSHFYQPKRRGKTILLVGLHENINTCEFSFLLISLANSVGDSSLSADMKNISILHQLDRPNKDLTSAWAMMPPISSDLDPSSQGVDNLHGKEEKEKKGSQFAKFINERKELFRKSSDLNTPQDLSRDTIPSKL